MLDEVWLFDHNGCQYLPNRFVKNTIWVYRAWLYKAYFEPYLPRVGANLATPCHLPFIWGMVFFSESEDVEANEVNWGWDDGIKDDGI